MQTTTWADFIRNAAATVGARVADVIHADTQEVDEVLGLRYLCPARVNAVRDEPRAYGFRCDTVEGHIERGTEWFLLTKDKRGDIRFRIEARW